MLSPVLERNREFMKSNLPELKLLQKKDQTDRQKGLPRVPLQKAPCPGCPRSALPKDFEAVLKKRDLLQCIRERRSHRVFSREPLSLDEVSFLLWATQGIQKVTQKGGRSYRPVASSGACHAYETYLVVQNIRQLNPGIYHYLPPFHEVEFLFEPEQIERSLDAITDKQAHARNAAVVFAWACRPNRTEWNYHLMAHKGMLIDAGHIGQNLYLACEAVSCGVVTCDWYFQEDFDNLLHLDGQEEFVVYFASVGKLKDRRS